MVTKISSLDIDYTTGKLSNYPVTIDTRRELYEVKNNAETTLAHSINYNNTYLVVEDTSKFPSQGLLKVGEETIYYDAKTPTVFKKLIRGFCSSKQRPWPSGTKVANAVFAEPHNALKDAIINIETNLGIDSNDATDTSLNGILLKQEQRFLAPKPIFKASIRRGASPLRVKFQNFSGGDLVRCLWTFGDGSQSIEFAPEHVYLNAGTYEVKLNVITSLGAQGIATKSNYIIVDDSLKEGFYYTNPISGTTDTAFEFVDQTSFDVVSRYWIFGDGTTESITDPDVHSTFHTYSEAGVYETALIVVFEDQSIRRYVTDSVIVT